ncbi:MAG: hypothetical protein L0216_21120 [Planctomycetales bacterium]|nr:hypothetical protein [Planctomycetales bacterium]
MCHPLDDAGFRCEACGLRTATVHQTEVRDAGVSERHLCADCAKTAKLAPEAKPAPCAHETCDAAQAGMISAAVHVHFLRRA